MSERISPSLVVQVLGLVVGASIVWGFMSHRVEAIDKASQDQELRLREARKDIDDLRRDVVIGLMDLKGEFGIIKTRLTAIEKAVKL